jgi:peptidoglycan/LPS O-acetylase OafA/YrhL
MDTPIHQKYRPDIDGLRAIAVLSVVVFHGFPNILPGGYIGVDVFFVISGFLISSIIFKNLDNSSFSFLDFYSRRIRRIFPSLILVLVFSYLVGWLTLFAAEYEP